MKSDICIVGGGPAGLAAAIALTQSGREVTVLDCAIPPIDKPCGEGLMPDGLKALERLGITPRGGAPLRGIRFIGSESSVSSDFPNGTGRGLRRVVLHKLLISQAEQLGVRMLSGVKNVHTRRGLVTFTGGQISTQLIIGADGQQSGVRYEAGLHRVVSEKRRYGFTKHYGLAPWSPYVEIYWGNHFQVYVTPIASDEVCVALISTDRHLRLCEALASLPMLAERLGDAPATSPERGALSVSRRLERVYTDGYVLLGDASGSVDAITGEGLCLAFRQSQALVQALDVGDLRLYQRSHQRIGTKPLQMAALMLLLDKNQAFQRKTLAALSTHPQVFSSILAAHVGHKPLANIVSWRLVSFGFGVICA